MNNKTEFYESNCIPVTVCRTRRHNFWLIFILFQITIYSLKILGKCFNVHYTTDTETEQTLPPTFAVILETSGLYSVQTTFNPSRNRNSRLELLQLTLIP